MKFEVGDVLVDVEGYPDGSMRCVTVENVEQQDEGSGKYYLQYEAGLFMWRSADIVEKEFRKAPTGSVAWLIHELSKFDPLDTVYYTDGWDGEKITDVEERYEGAVSIC